MRTALFTHGVCLDHDTGPGHPERPDRLSAVLNALAGDEFALLIRRQAPPATIEQLTRVHDPAYVDQVLAAAPEQGRVRLDPDTLMSPKSGAAALRAAGAVCAAVDFVISGQATNAFCAVRPPGHHAEPSTAMGFCLFNNIATGAFHARAAHGLERVAVVDFDVHHGNGTQDAFHGHPGLFFASTHQSPLYPGTGLTGEEGGAGNIHNVPLPPGAGSREFRAAFEARILPALDAFGPQFILVSAGFDAHANDPLAQLNLTEDDFGWATRQLVERAALHCQERLVSTLEGGYNLAALRASAKAHLRALIGREAVPGQTRTCP
ncbi:MAG: histone deacetylase family protein [Sphingomonadales bacterium]